MNLFNKGLKGGESMLTTVEPLYYGHYLDHIKCPDYEVSLFQRLLCTLLYVAGITGSVLIREVSLFQRSLIERFHCIMEIDRSMISYFRKDHLIFISLLCTLFLE